MNKTEMKHEFKALKKLYKKPELAMEWVLENMILGYDLTRTEKKDIAKLYEIIKDSVIDDITLRRKLANKAIEAKEYQRQYYLKKKEKQNNG